MRVLIVGANGFIGHSLVQRILQTTAWEVCGIDLSCSRLTGVLGNPRFTFHQSDIRHNHGLMEDEVSQSDVVLPLAATANPMVYVKEPLYSFEIVFEENLRIIKLCAKYQVRLVFPSTSEVYGMCSDSEFSENSSLPTFGPVHKERWIYASSKHLLERVIWSLGHSGLTFTIFRPFNWFGPNLDNIGLSSDGAARVVTLFLGRMLRGEVIRLVDGGQQTRSFTYIDDGIDALMLILTASGGIADGQIFNIGNPHNHCSIAELAQRMVALLAQFPEYAQQANNVRYEAVSAAAYYGDAYQDVPHRKPEIQHIHKALGWSPRVGLDEALEKTLQWYCAQDPVVADSNDALMPCHS